MLQIAKNLELCGFWEAQVREFVEGFPCHENEEVVDVTVVDGQGHASMIWVTFDRLTPGKITILLRYRTC